MDMKKLWKILSPIAVLVMVAGLFMASQCTSCQTVFTNMNEMEEADFQMLETEIYLITKLGCREIFKAKPEAGKMVSEALGELVPYLDTLSPESVSFITNMVGKLTEKITDPDVQVLIELAILQVNKYGGFKYVEKVDLGIVLSERSVRLIQALVKGMLDAAGNTVG